MKISPINDCGWDYRGARLCVRLTADDGVTYMFETHYTITDLYDQPAAGTSFCVRDASLLTDFEEGLARVGLDDGACLDLGLNAVACARFVRQTVPVTRYFIRPRTGCEPKRGDVVSIYAKSGGIADCMVIEETDADYLCRLMLLNPGFSFSDREIRKCRLGAMIRVRSDMVCTFRNFARQGEKRYA